METFMDLHRDGGWLRLARELGEHLLNTAIVGLLAAAPLAAPYLVYLPR
jgi:hypothetical protein